MPLPCGTGRGLELPKEPRHPACGSQVEHTWTEKKKCSSEGKSESFAPGSSQLASISVPFSHTRVEVCSCGGAVGLCELHGDLAGCPLHWGSNRALLRQYTLCLKHWAQIGN